MSWWAKPTKRSGYISTTRDELIVVAAGHEADPLDAILIELGHPALGLLFAGTRLFFRFGEIKGEPPLLAGAGQLLIAEGEPRFRRFVLDRARFPGPQASPPPWVRSPLIGKWA